MVGSATKELRRRPVHDKADDRARERDDLGDRLFQDHLRQLLVGQAGKTILPDGQLLRRDFALTEHQQLPRIQGLALFDAVNLRDEMRERGVRASGVEQVDSQAEGQRDNAADAGDRADDALIHGVLVDDAADELLRVVIGVRCTERFVLAVERVLVGGEGAQEAREVTDQEEASDQQDDGGDEAA